MHGQIVSRGNSTGLGHINILLDLSSTRDYRMLLCMIGMMEKMLVLQHKKWLDQGSNPDPSGTVPDALPLSYQVLQGIAMWPDSPFHQLGLWDINLFFLLHMWGVLGLWLSCSRMLWPFGDTSTNQISSLPWLLIPSGQKSSIVSSLVRQLLIVLILYHRSLSKRKKHSSSSLIDNGFFGTTVTHIHTIEFQKRDLPHIYLLTFLHSQHHIWDSYHINSMISAQLPDPQLQPLLYAKVTKYMLHGPCGIDNPQAKCMVNEKCSKHFPKKYRERTDWAEDSYPLYARPNNGLVFEWDQIHQSICGPLLSSTSPSLWLSYQCWDLCWIGNCQVSEQVHLQGSW